MTIQTEYKQPTTLKISLEERPDFKGEIVTFLFNTAGNLLETARVTHGKASFSCTEEELARNRLFIAPMPVRTGEVQQRTTIKMMERLGAYEPVLKQKGKLIDTVRVPGSKIDRWPLCSCYVSGHVVKEDSGLPVSGARVHICEVDKLGLWILKLTDSEVLKFRDDFLAVIDNPTPLPEPGPSVLMAMRTGLINIRRLDPQPEPPPIIGRSTQTLMSRPIQLKGALNPQPQSSAAIGQLQSQATLMLPSEVRAALTSASPQVVRKGLVDNVIRIIPYLCQLYSWMWEYGCDEVAVVDTDPLGHFEATVNYSCIGDKPDLYFWVEFELFGTWETVYRPSIGCHTYWNYACGTDVVIRIANERVPASNTDPDLTGCVVQIVSIGRSVSVTDITDEGLTKKGEPFGGKLEPRVWFSRTNLLDKRIKYYRWSYRRLPEGKGIVLNAPGPWTPLSRKVVTHYAKKVSNDDGVVHVPYDLGPKEVGSEKYLFEIRPAELSDDIDPDWIEWTVVDEREDLASAHFETDKLGNGETASLRALDAAGKYELKLELFKENGTLVDWKMEGIDVQVPIPKDSAPFGTEGVTFEKASDYYHKDAAGKPVAFRMVLRVDNNCCEAYVNQVCGKDLTTTKCGFIEYPQGAQETAQATLSFKPYHPNGFATFDFSVVRGPSTNIPEASLPNTEEHKIGIEYTPYTVGSAYTYQGNFYVSDLLKVWDPTHTVIVGNCERAAFSEALHVWAMATDGYYRLWYLDAFAHDGFALTKPTP